MRFISRTACACLFFILPAIAFAQIPNATTSPKPIELPAKKRGARVNVNANGAIHINYGQPRWNKSPQAIDSATVIMREGVTGRIVQIQLNETAPDSSVFSGIYSIAWQNMDKLETEFYVPSQDQLAEKDGLAKITKKIQAHEISRNPFILRRQATGEQSVEIFDTKDQARAAMKVYRAEQLVVLQNQKPTKFPSDQDLDTEKEASVRKEREDAAKAASDRARMEQVEAARLADLIAKQKAMNESEKQKQRDEAAALGREGLKRYVAGDYPGAKEKFDKAVALDPDNRLFYYQYGVALYKTGDYNRALIFLGLASGTDVNPVEKNYFLALVHLKLKESDAALKSFDDVVSSKDKVMAPSAQYYRGTIFFERQDYDVAQKSFQAVLDSSDDSKLDEQAEAYVELILRMKQIAAERDHKWSVSAALGEIYDSNILLTSTSQRDAGTATDAAGWRTMLSGSARFRPVFSDTQEFAAQIDLLTLYSLTQKFAASDTLRNTDPTVATLTLPWTHKGTWLEKGHKLDIIPGYESTFMSIENNQTKAIISSALLSFSNLLVMSEKWFWNTTVDLRRDQSNLLSSVGDNDSTALKGRLGTTNLLYLNDKKDHMLIPEAAITMNQAQGRNATYNRFDLGVGYLAPWKWETTANFKLAYFYLDYPTKLVAERTDNDYMLTAGLSRKLSEIWTTGLIGSYNINTSNEDANTYNKFTVLLTLSAAYGF